MAKTIRLYGYVIDTLRGYQALGMPLLTEEQALLTRAIKSLSTCRCTAAEIYIREAEKLLTNK